MLLFDQLRTLEWEQDPLIDVQGIVNVLDRDEIVTLQRKYTRPLSDPELENCYKDEGYENTNNKNGNTHDHGNDSVPTATATPRPPLFCDSEQAAASPWSRSPAPSPAVREYAENPFFNPSNEMEQAFDDPDPKSIQGNPVDAIGFEDTYSIVHMLLIVPTSTSYQRSAPIGILSFMSSLIPFPNELRLCLDKLAPHIATAFLQARAHSDLTNQLDIAVNRGYYRRPLSTPYSYSPRPDGAKKPARRSPYTNLSPSTSGINVDEENQGSGLEKLEKLSKFYSSLREDLMEDSLTTKSLEIFAADSNDSHKETQLPSTQPVEPSKLGVGKRPHPHSRRFMFSRNRVRPHIRKLLHSYGASFVAEPEKASNQSPGASTTNVNSIDHGDLRRRSKSTRSSFETNHKKKISTGFELASPSNRLLRTIIDAIPVHVFTAEPVGGDVTWVSNRTLAFRGQTAEEFVTDPASSLHPSERDEYREAWDAALRKGEPLSRMVQVKRFDDRYRTFFMRAVPLRDDKGIITHWFCTMMDIHNQRQAHLEAVQHAHETAGDQKYKSLAESTPIIVFTTHPTKGVQYANNKWYEYSGRTPAETLGFQYIQAIHPDDRKKGMLPYNREGKHDDSQFQGKEFMRGIYTVELRILNKEGEYRWHLATFTCSDKSSPTDAVWFGTCTDIHDQKLIQEKLKEAKDAAQRTIESKTQFLSNMSHEIRTPLIGISGMVAFLLDTKLTDEQLDYCHTISSSSEALLMVINDILDLSKVESGKMTLTSAWFHVRQLVEEVNELLSSMAISKNLELNYIIESDVPTWVKGDRIRLRQVMLNLTGNAIKFTDEGEIFVSCKIGHRQVEPELEEYEMMLEFSVHDTGRGFTSEDATRMFQPFSQVHASNVPVAGTGLGLVISKQLVSLHGGDLTCKGEKGVGSTFTFDCRVTLPSKTDQPSEQEIAKMRGARRRSGYDDDDIQNEENGVKRKPRLVSQLRIMVVCPLAFTFKSISYHIKSTVADPEKCDIRSVTGAEDLMQQDFESTPKWSHVVVNLLDVEEIVKIVEFMFETERKRSVELIILTTPIQRSQILKLVSGGERQQQKITFLPKPLKPSRYSVVFDPSWEREESHDMKMQNAQQALESQKNVFDDLASFAYGKGYRILLAEDNLVNQKVMSKFLAKAGLNCDVAADGEVCTKKLFDKGPGYYHLILCDLDMPRKDGFEACEDIRKWEKQQGCPPIPIVALSAYVMSDMSDKCDLAGFTRYISKPVEFSNLKDMIIEILKDSAP
jgi:PAS domain S-box-containing protein